MNSCHFVNVEKQNKICLTHSWEVIIYFIFYSIRLLLQTSPKKYVCKVKQSLYDVTKLHIKNILAGNQQPNTINWKYFEVEYKEHVKHFRYFQLFFTCFLYLKNQSIELKSTWLKIKMKN